MDLEVPDTCRNASLSVITMPPPPFLNQWEAVERAHTTPSPGPDRRLGHDRRARMHPGRIHSS